MCFAFRSLFSMGYRPDGESAIVFLELSLYESVKSNWAKNKAHWAW